MDTAIRDQRASTCRLCNLIPSGMKSHLQRAHMCTQTKLSILISMSLRLCVYLGGCSKQGGLPRKIPKAPPTHPIPPTETPAHTTSCCGPLLLETAITFHQRKGVRGPCSVQMTDDSEVKQRVSRAPCMLAWFCLTLICFLPLILIQFSSCISPGPQRS